MLPEQRDAAYLWDMLEAAKQALEITAEMTYDRYRRERVVQLAVERTIEIVGEAARKVSEPLKAAHPEIPWRQIIAQRHVIAHEYGDIKQDRLWLVVTARLPELVVQLQTLIPPSPPSTE